MTVPQDIEGLATLMAEQFVGGFNAAMDLCVETIRSTPPIGTGEPR